MAKQIKVREDNYFAVQGWMVTELKLKGNALMLYAIIYGFSQTTNTAFTGSVDYLCEWLGGVSRPTVINTLDNLVKQGLLTKSTVAWNMGYKILMYSGEMSTAMVGFRFDTLNKHFSNMGLLNGSGTLGKKPDTDGAKYLQEDYEKYITQLQQKSGFIVVTPDDFEGRKPNVDEIKSLAIKHGADMIVIDQLSLMSDKRRADIPRIAYNNISEDLFLMSKELKKPVLLMAQANREAVKNRKKGESPELHDLAESDGVGQNATRVLSLSVIDGTLKISVKKNRYGINNKEVLMIWEVNTGYLKPLLSENPEESTEDKKDDKPDGEKDKGGEKDYGF